MSLVIRIHLQFLSLLVQEETALTLTVSIHKKRGCKILLLDRQSWGLGEAVPKSWAPGTKQDRLELLVIPRCSSGFPAPLNYESVACWTQSKVLTWCEPAQLCWLQQNLADPYQMRTYFQYSIICFPGSLRFLPEMYSTSVWHEWGLCGSRAPHSTLIVSLQEGTYHGKFHLPLLQAYPSLVNWDQQRKEVTFRIKLFSGQNIFHPPRTSEVSSLCGGVQRVTKLPALLGEALETKLAMPWNLSNHLSTALATQWITLKSDVLI